MSEHIGIQRWCELINARGVAGLGARETEEEKLIVEQGIFNDFVDTSNRLANVLISNVTPEPPPLPDFSCEIDKRCLRFELTELIDSEIIKEAKHIRKEPEHPLHKEAITFEINSDWFSKILQNTIVKKEQKYAERDTKIDVLLIWNEALELRPEVLERWLQSYEIPSFQNIHSVYFQNWYHPNYIARPTWSLKAHPSIGEMIPAPKEQDT